jgi:hypothetical protein
MTRLEAWDAEKQRYALTELSRGAFAYLVKPEARGTEPLHCLCAACYQNGKKAILQFLIDQFGTAHFTCPACRTEFQAWSENLNFPFPKFRR